MKKAFTLAELCTVIIILGIIAAVIAKITFRTPQGQFDIKYDKTASVISSNIQMGLTRRTGFAFNDYNTNNAAFLSDVTANLNGSRSSINAAWSDNTNVDGVNISSYNVFLMNDGTVIAIDNAGTNIFIDVNGQNRPNEFGRDIFRYNAIALNRAIGGAGGGGGAGDADGGGGADGGDETPTIVEPKGCSDPGHANTNAVWTYNSENCKWTPSCTGNWTLSGNSCVCNLAQKTENNIIYTADTKCNYQATACATTTSSDATYTYTHSLPNCVKTKSGCVNTKKTLSSGGSCVCKDPSTKNDGTYVYTINSSCVYSKTGCAKSGYTLSGGSCLKTCTSSQITNYLTAHYRCAGKTCARSGDDRRKAACKEARTTCANNCPGNAYECANNSHVIVNDNNSSKVDCKY